MTPQDQPTSQNNNPQDDQNQLPTIPTSLDDIVDSSMSDYQGDDLATHLNNTPNPTTPGPTSTSSPTQSTDITVDDLLEDINSATLEDGKSEKSISSFEGLKTRYKNKVVELKETINSLQTQLSEVSNKYQDYETVKEKATKLEEAQAELNQIRNEAATLQEENKSLSVYQKKYDLENNPEIKRTYLNPMSDYKTRALDIIQGAELPDSTWQELTASANSEFKLNNAIERTGVTGFNATSLKDSVLKYASLKQEYDQATSPEYIDGLITTAKGRAVRVSEETADEIFKDVKTNFFKAVEELNESEVNKEHNLFIYNKVVEQAQNNYNALRKAIGEEFQNPNVMGVLSQAAFSTASYPALSKTNSFLLKKNLELIDYIKDLENTTPSTKQTVENRNGNSNTFTGDIVDAVKSATSKSLEDIAGDAD